MKTLLSLHLILCSLASLQAFQIPASHSRVARVSFHDVTPWRGVSSSPHRPAAVTSTTSLKAFLPPSGGGGGGGKNSELGDIITAALTFVGVIAFFASPLGAIFFALFNSLLALAFLLPIGAIVAYNVWQYFNTIEGPCPNCGAPVRVLKDESPSLCFTCGAVVLSRDDQIFIANPNQGNVDIPRGNGVTAWLDELGGGGRTTSVTKKTTIIDVDVEREDWG